MDDVYRSCASIVVLRPSNVCAPASPAKPGSSSVASTKVEGRSGEGCDTVYEVLLLHKPRKKDAWQLPQGGVEGDESIQEAAVRELKEEAGIDAEVLCACSHVYQYDFPKSYRKFRPDNVCGQKVEYVIAAVKGDQAVQVDDDEVDSFAWVLPEQIDHYIHRKEYLDIVQKLVAEGIERISE